MGLDQRRGAGDARIIGRERAQQARFLAPPEQLVLQLVQLAGDVVLAVEIGVVEHLGEDVLGQDVLDQHFLHVILAHRRIDRLLRVGEECGFGLGEIRWRRACRRCSSRRASSTAGRSAANCSTALLKSAISCRSCAKNASAGCRPSVSAIARGAHDLGPVLDQHGGVIVGR